MKKKISRVVIFNKLFLISISHHVFSSMLGASVPKLTVSNFTVNVSQKEKYAARPVHASAAITLQGTSKKS